MRFEVVNTHTSVALPPVAVPVGKNPVTLGGAATNDVRLLNGFIGQRAIEIRRKRGRSWTAAVLDTTLVKLNGREILEGSAHEAPLKSNDCLTFEGFEIRIFFDHEELDEPIHSWKNNDRSSSEMVRSIHSELSKSYGKKSAQEISQSHGDDFITKLEGRIDEAALATGQFPTDDMNTTPLGNHFAGAYVRASLLDRVIARDPKQTGLPTMHSAAWARLRSEQTHQKQAGERVVDLLEQRLGVGIAGDTTEQVRRVEKDFWADWQQVLEGGSRPASALLRHLALNKLKLDVKDYWYGYGPLQELLGDVNISEIMVVDKDHIFVEKNGRLENSGRRFVDDEITEMVMQKIVGDAGRHVNAMQPLADARMFDGSRVNAVIPPIALKGPCLTIRRFPIERRTIESLLNQEHGYVSEAAVAFLKAAVLGRKNIIISGGTGSGKTTLLNCLSAFIPDHERIVTIEDTAELQLAKEHVVILQSRRKNLEGKGEITIAELVKNSLRMRPDRIIVGECRGGEALDMLQAMNTGHDGSMTTLHANNPDDAVGRMEVMVQRAENSNLPTEAIRRQIASAVDVIVQLNRSPKGRIVSSVVEVVAGDRAGELRLIPLFARPAVYGRLMPTGHLASFVPELVEQGWITDPVSLLRGASLGGER